MSRPQPGSSVPEVAAQATTARDHVSDSACSPPRTPNRRSTDQRRKVQRSRTPAVLEVLGSIGDPELEPKIQQLMTDPDPEIPRAASDAHRVMQFQMQAPTP